MKMLPICLQVTTIAYSQQPPDALQISAPASKVTYNQCVINYVKRYSSLEALLQEHFALPTEARPKFLNSWEIIVL